MRLIVRILRSLLDDREILFRRFSLIRSNRLFRRLLRRFFHGFFAFVILSFLRLCCGIDFVGRGFRGRFVFCSLSLFGNVSFGGFFCLFDRVSRFCRLSCLLGRCGLLGFDCFGDLLGIGFLGDVDDDFLRVIRLRLGDRCLRDGFDEVFSEYGEAAALHDGEHHQCHKRERHDASPALGTIQLTHTAFLSL